MLNVFPQLADAEIDYAWGGIIDISMSRAPNFGRLEPNVYFLQGYLRPRHGRWRRFGGKVVAEAIAGQAERFDVYRATQASRLPGRQAVPQADARDGHDLVPDAGFLALGAPDLLEPAVGSKVTQQLDACAFRDLVRGQLADNGS